MRAHWVDTHGYHNWVWFPWVEDGKAPTATDYSVTVVEGTEDKALSIDVREFVPPAGGCLRLTWRVFWEADAGLLMVAHGHMKEALAWAVLQAEGQFVAAKFKRKVESDREGVRTGAALYRHSTGATRSHLATPYHLLPKFALERLAARHGVGAINHGPWNWEQGLPWEDSFNHLIDHLYNWRDNHRKLMDDPRALDNQTFEDDLAAAGLGVIFLMHFELRVKGSVGYKIAREGLAPTAVPGARTKPEADSNGKAKG